MLLPSPGNLVGNDNWSHLTNNNTDYSNCENKLESRGKLPTDESIVLLYTIEY